MHATSLLPLARAGAISFGIRRLFFVFQLALHSLAKVNYETTCPRCYADGLCALFSFIGSL